jgi:hypothetical protein
VANPRGGLDARGAELVAELLERWFTLEPSARMQLARQLLAAYGAAAAGAGADDGGLHAQLLRLAGAPAAQSPP